MVSPAGEWARDRWRFGLTATAESPTEAIADLRIQAAAVALSVLFGVALAATVHPVAAVLVVPAIRIVPRFVERPVYTAYALAFLVPITAGFARGLPVPGLRISEVLIVGGFGLIVLVQRDRVVPWRPVDTATVVYAGATVVLGVFAIVFVAGSAEGIVSLFFPLQFVMLYFAIRLATTTDRERHIVLALLLVGVIPVGMLALAQQFDVLGARGLVSLVTGSDFFTSWSYVTHPRATGPFDGWHPLAGYLFIPTLICVGLLLRRVRGPIPPRFIAVVGFVALGALALSQTLNVLITAIAGGITLGFLAGRSRAALEWLVVLAVVGGALFGSAVFERIERQLDDAEQADPDSALPIPGTIQYRFDVWEEQFFPSIERYWTTGYGPELPEEITWRHTESIYITLLLRGGLPLLLAFVWLNVELWRLARSAAQSDGLDPTVLVLAQVLMVVVMLLIPMHAVYPYLTGSGMSQVLWVVAAVVASALDSAEGSARTQSSGPSSFQTRDGGR